MSGPRLAPRWPQAGPRWPQSPKFGPTCWGEEAVPEMTSNKTPTATARQARTARWAGEGGNGPRVADDAVYHGIGGGPL